MSASADLAAKQRRHSDQVFGDSATRQVFPDADGIAADLRRPWAT